MAPINLKKRAENDRDFNMVRAMNWEELEKPEHFAITNAEWEELSKTPPARQEHAHLIYSRERLPDEHSRRLAQRWGNDIYAIGKIEEDRVSMVLAIRCNYYDAFSSFGPIHLSVLGIEAWEQLIETCSRRAWILKERHAIPYLEELSETARGLFHQLGDYYDLPDPSDSILEISLIEYIFRPPEVDEDREEARCTIQYQLGKEFYEYLGELHQHHRETGEWLEDMPPLATLLGCKEHTEALAGVRLPERVMIGDQRVYQRTLRWCTLAHYPFMQAA